MNTATHDGDSHRSGIPRRRLLIGGATAALGAAAAVGIDGALRPDETVSAPLNGTERIAFFGRHQGGIDIAPQAHQSLLALDIRPGIDKDDIRRMLTVLTNDAARLTQGNHALGDSEPEFAKVPARLTVTFGFGPGLVALIGGKDAVPSWLNPLPAYQIDRLQGRWNGGDLLLQIASDDQVTVAHTMRMMTKDARAFATTKWHQPGFRRAHGSEQLGTTMRNLLGQIDGTSNLQPGTRDFAELVWRDDTWLTNGTTMVVRRTEMLMDKWDRLDRDGREKSMGRKLDTGAPLTGTRESDEPDFTATTPIGFPIIAEFAHIRRARTDDTTQRMYRRGYNYDLGPRDDIASDSGLVFTSFQRDLEHQFMPIQARLAELDLLNEWTVPIGSAVFAIPGGCREDEFIGQALFT